MNIAKFTYLGLSIIALSATACGSSTSNNAAAGGASGATAQAGTGSGNGGTTNGAGGTANNNGGTANNNGGTANNNGGTANNNGGTANNNGGTANNPDGGGNNLPDGGNNNPDADGGNSPLCPDTAPGFGGFGGGGRCQMNQIGLQCSYTTEDCTCVGPSDAGGFQTRPRWMCTPTGVNNNQCPASQPDGGTCQQGTGLCQYGNTNCFCFNGGWVCN